MFTLKNIGNKLSLFEMCTIFVNLVMTFLIVYVVIVDKEIDFIASKINTVNGQIDVEVNAKAEQTEQEINQLSQDFAFTENYTFSIVQGALAESDQGYMQTLYFSVLNEFSEMLRNFSQSAGYAGLYVIDPEGNILVAYEHYAEQPNLYYKKQDDYEFRGQNAWVKSTYSPEADLLKLEDRTLFVKDGIVYISLLMAPIPTQPELGSILVIQEITPLFLQRIKSLAGADINLMGNNSYVFGTQPNFTNMAALTDINQQEINLFSYNDTEYLGGVVVLSEFNSDGLSFVILVPHQQIDNQVGEVLLKIILFGLLIGIVTLIVLRVVVRKTITDPMHELQSSATRLADGKFDCPLPVHKNDELGDLARSYSQMREVILENLTSLRSEVLQRQEAELALSQLNQALEEKVEKRSQEIKSTYKKLLDTEAKLNQQAQLASLGHFTVGVSHELNTPIGICITAYSSIKDGFKSLKDKTEHNQLTKGDLKHFFSLIEDAGELLEHNLTRSTELLISLKQVVSGRFDNTSEPENLELITQSALSQLKEVKSRPNITIHQLVEKNQSIILPRKETETVILAIVENALLHGFNEGHSGNIYLYAQTKNETVDFVIEDDGIGIDDNTLTQIYHPFYTNARHKNCVGLGMYTVQNIVSLNLKGSVLCQSEIGKGTRFIISVPITKNSINNQG